MKQLLFILLLIILFISANAQEGNFWSDFKNESILKEKPLSSALKLKSKKLFKLDDVSLRKVLSSAPSNNDVAIEKSSLILLFPNPQGDMEKYRVVLSPMDRILSDKFPEIRSYRGQGIDDPTATIGFDFSPSGFHGMVISAKSSTFLIDPVDSKSALYIVYRRVDIEDTLRSFKCSTSRFETLSLQKKFDGGIVTDGKLRTFKLALACTGEYAQYFIRATDITVIQKKSRVLGAMNTLRNRVNMIYERDLSIHLDFVSNNDAIIFLDPNSDDWNGEYNIQTQLTINSVIGSSNYDIGHLVHKVSLGNEGGNAGCIGCVCKPYNNNPSDFEGKGGGFTSHSTPEEDPFVVDYVAHEMGHQFGGTHTFNASTVSCSGAGSSQSNAEPGSGSTIMAYAGICGATNNLQLNSDPFFHAVSLSQIKEYTVNGIGNTCAVKTTTGNNVPQVVAGADYTIPHSTPFKLAGLAADPNNDALSYNWEQIDVGGPFGDWNAPDGDAPIFRSFAPTTSPERTFPQLSDILNNTTTKGEILPGYSRTMNFRLTARDNKVGGGEVGFDDVKVDVSRFSGPFSVTAANSPVTWEGNSCQLITWDVANTDSRFTVNCRQVKISFSTDGGQTFPTVLLANTDNDGKESVQVPAVTSSTCRIKIEAIGNIFFDINNADITVSGTSNLSFSVATTDVTGCSKSDGKAVINISGAPAGAIYEYAVDGNYSNSNSFDNLAMGTYTATIRDKNSKCELSKDFTVGGFTSLKVGISGTGFQTFCVSQSAQATLTASASGGSGNYTYSWPGGTKTVSSSGLYNVTVTDNINGCTKSAGGFVFFVPVICSRDPNDIIGPVGYGNGKMVSKFEQMPYMIRFENDPDFATAPAQVVKITDPLDSNLNLLSLRLGDFGFGGFVFTVPANRTFYSTRLDLKDSIGVIVDVTAGIDITKKEAFWIFEAKDPATGLPPVNASLGFLPINDSITHKGEGFVNYTIKPANHTQTGDTVHAAASIVFDVNAPLATPAIFNTIDAEYPVSNLSNLPATSDTNTILVKWTGHDEPKGSGVRLYDLYVSDNGGPFTEYQTGITDTSATFTGMYGHTYDFFIRATDNTGNKEAIQTTYEQRVTIRSNLVKPNLGADTTIRKCPGESVNLNNLYSLTGLYGVWNTPTDSAQVASGVFTLIANNSSGLKDTALVTIIDYQKPAVGNDSTVGYCTGSFVNLRNVYTTAGYTSAVWNTSNVDSARAGTYTLIVSNTVGCKDTAVVSVVSNPKPNLGNDTSAAVCIGSTTNIRNLYNTSAYTSALWSISNPESVGAGTYTLIVTNSFGCKDTAVVVVTNNTKPDLGTDKVTTVSCAGGTADITTLYITNGFSSAIYSAPVPTAAAPGVYNLIVTNANGCKDTAIISVQPANTETVRAIPNTIKAANRECTDSMGWTHYYNDNGTPTDFSDDIRLLSLKKNGNNIGTVGDGTFLLRVGATAGASSGHAVKVNSPLLLGGTSFYSMNRYWDIMPATQPASPVNLRFYYNTQDLTDINGDYPLGPITHTRLNMYKLTGGNPDPATNWAGATAATYYQHGVAPSLTNWVYTALDSTRHQAEFVISTFSGGGGGATAFNSLPVTFIKFDVAGESDKVKVLWSTATEINSKHYLIQRSLDGNTFENIATVAAAGNSNTVQNYSYDDIQVMQYQGRTVYYRIYQVDFNNQGKYTDVKSVKIANRSNELILLYNPVKQEAMLKYNCTEKDKVMIRVVDQLGRVALVKTVSVEAGVNQIRLSTSALAKGIYEVELTSPKDHQRVRMMKE